MTHRRLALTVAVALALLAGACSSPGNKPSAVGRDHITVVLDWTPNTNHSGVYLAKAKGWYASAGIDVKIIEPGDAGAVNLVATGKADVGFSAQEELIPARTNEHVPVVAIAAVIQHNTSSLLSLAKTGIEGPADLAGHTYGGYGGDLERALVSKLVRCAGGDPKAVRYADVGDVDYRVGLEKGQYDDVWIYDGWDKIRLQQIDELDVSTIPFIDHADCIPDWYTPMLFTSEKELSGRSAALKRFMAATARGYREAMSDPAAAAKALTDAVPELDPDLVRRSARYLSTRYTDDPARWGQQDTAVWQRFSRFLSGAGMLDEDLEVSSAFTNRLLPTGGP